VTSTRALGYVRVSNDEQASKVYGLDIQRRAIRDYCKANRLLLVDIVTDFGISGSNGFDSRQVSRTRSRGSSGTRRVFSSCTASIA